MARDTLRDYPHHTDGKDVTGRARPPGCAASSRAVPGRRSAASEAGNLHALSPALLIGSLVAARLGRRRPAVARSPGLPVAADLPRHRPGHRRGRAFGHRVRLQRAHPGARLRRPHPHPQRGRAEHEVGGHPRARSARRRAVDGRRHRLGRRRRRRRPLRAAPRLEHRPADRRDPVLDRRRGGVLGAAPGAAPPPDHRHARGRVRLQRRPRGHPRDRARRRSRPTPAHAEGWFTLALKAVAELGAGAAIGLAVGLARWPVHAPVPRPAPRACSASGWSPSPSSRMPRRPACTPAGSSPATSRRWCWATCGCRTGRPSSACRPRSGWLAQIGLFVLLGPARRHPARWATRSCPAIVHRPGAAALRPTPVGHRCRSRRSGLGWRDQVFLSWAGLRGAVPVVLATVPLTVGAPRTSTGSSSSSSSSS